MKAEEKFLSDLTQKQIAFRTEMIEDLLEHFRSEYCCSRVVLEGGRDFRMMPYNELLDKWTSYFPSKPIPEGCRV